MPTEAEWEYAAAGGSENRLYPWGSADPMVDKTLANFASSDNSPFLAVGSHPSGNGRWGHRDLAGGVWEWNLDWVAMYSTAPCNDCANVASGSNRVYRGGGWSDNANYLRAARRISNSPAYRNGGVGFRCARTP